MEIRERIAALVAEGPVVLFMKGNRRVPQCGFSARVVDVLDEYLDDYRTHDVLSDSALREGIKEFGQWPTIPQLYVRGSLIGGADIVAEMHQQGELGTLLGVAASKKVEEPSVTFSEAAVQALIRYADGARPSVRLTIDRSFAAELDLAPPEEGDLSLELTGLTLSIDRASARRADGVRIDFVEGPGGSGFRVDNPNAPPKVRTLSVEELASMRDKGKPHLLIDVRTEEERTLAKVDGSVWLDDLKPEMDELDRSTTMIFMCHHGVRSRAAAEHCLRMGFADVWNVEGGIDAWSLRVDRGVPRY